MLLAVKFASFASPILGVKFCAFWAFKFDVSACEAV